MLELASRGWSVTGFDASRPMLGHARRRLSSAGRRARLIEARLEGFDVGRGYHLAHCLVSTFKYLLDEASARRHLELVAEALAPGGIYVLGLHLTDYEDRRRSRERWEVAGEDCRVVCTIEGWPPARRGRLERVRSRLRVAEGGERRAFETNWSFRTYSPGQLQRLLRSVRALELVGLYDFTYELSDPRELDDGYLDKVLVLRRRHESPE